MFRHRSSDDLANLWLPKFVQKIRAFKVEHWSEFTGIMKS